jgi:hypothetical protein
MPDNSATDVLITDKNGTVIPMGYSDGTRKSKLAEEDLAKHVP